MNNAGYRQVGKASDHEALSSMRTTSGLETKGAYKVEDMTGIQDSSIQATEIPRERGDIPA